MAKHLEISTQLNRNTNFCELKPKKTTADGNCLIHATTFFLFGQEDTDFKTRQIINQMMIDSSDEMKRRWKVYELEWMEKYSETLSLKYGEDDWKDEWEVLVNLTSAIPNQNGAYNMLEIVHIFTLANHIKRPIIVVSAKFIESVDGGKLSPIELGGIYLPLLYSPGTVVHHC